MAKRHKTDYQIKQILKYNRDGCPSLRKGRHRQSMRIVSQLQELGYGKRWDVHKLSARVIHRLANLWRRQGNSHRTIANKVSNLRWLADKVNRSDQIPSNKNLGIGLRSSLPDYQTNKARPLLKKHLDQMKPRIRLVNELKAEFGLREEEACKFQHKYATAESDAYIKLHGSWCKGGRPRVIEIVNIKQRKLLERVKAHQDSHGEKSMIPKGRKSKAIQKVVQASSTSLGIQGHKFRHQWAQEKFIQVSGGLKPQLAGGPKFSSLSAEERASWERAAQRVNQELGHGKGCKDITANYIGGRG